MSGDNASASQPWPEEEFNTFVAMARENEEGSYFEQQTKDFQDFLLSLTDIELISRGDGNTTSLAREDIKVLNENNMKNFIKIASTRYKQKNEACQEEKKEISASYNQCEQTIETLTEQIKTVRLNFEAAQSQLTTKEGELETAQSQLTTKEGELETARSDLTTKRKNNIILRNQLDELKTAITSKNKRKQGNANSVNSFFSTYQAGTRDPTQVKKFKSDQRVTNTEDKANPEPHNAAELEEKEVESGGMGFSGGNGQEMGDEVGGPNNQMEEKSFDEFLQHYNATFQKKHANSDGLKAPISITRDDDDKFIHYNFIVVSFNNQEFSSSSSSSASSSSSSSASMSIASEIEPAIPPTMASNRPWKLVDVSENVNEKDQLDQVFPDSSVRTKQVGLAQSVIAVLRHALGNASDMPLEKGWAAINAVTSYERSPAEYMRDQVVLPNYIKKNRSIEDAVLIDFDEKATAIRLHIYTGEDASDIKNVNMVTELFAKYVKLIIDTMANIDCNGCDALKLHGASVSFEPAFTKRGREEKRKKKLRIKRGFTNKSTLPKKKPI